jgi:hypothetical protein
MANTLGGVNLTAIAQQSLDALIDQLAPLAAFTTDFSSEIAVEGSAVSTRVPTQTTSGDLSTGYSTNRQDVTTTVKTITLGDVRGSVIGFTDGEWSKSSINLQDIFVAPGVNAIADDMFDDVCALVTSTNFGSGTNDLLTVAEASFDADAVAQVAQKLSAKKVPRAGRFLMLKPSTFRYLVTDNAIQASYAYGGSEAIRENRASRIHGMDIYEVTDLGPQSENLIAFAGGKQGLLIAARTPAAPANFPGDLVNVTDPGTGFTLQLRRWYSADDGRHYLSMGAIWGVAVGVGGASGNIVRVVTS